MARTPQVPDESVAAAVELREAAKTIAEYRRAVAAIMFAHENNKFSAEEIGDILGVSRATIFAENQKTVPWDRIWENRNSTRYLTNPAPTR